MATDSFTPPTKQELAELREAYRAKRKLTDRQWTILAMVIDDAAEKRSEKLAANTFPMEIKVGNYSVEFVGVLTLKGCPPIPVRYVARPADALKNGHQLRSLVADEAGTYYSVEWHSLEESTDIPEADEPWTSKVSIVKKLTPGEAMDWVLDEYLWKPFDVCAHMFDQIRGACWAPEFEFMPLVAKGEPKVKVRRRKKDVLGPFAVQLEMATALVESVRKLDAAPAPDVLAEAQREVSKLHLSLHDPAAMKAATAA
jgi:hypothetical protein